MNPLVEPAWVASRLNDPYLVLLDATLPPVGVVPAVDTHACYLAEHLPGAVFFDIETLSDASSPLPHTLPSAESFGAAMSALGVSAGATIVVYEQGNVFSAPRAWWMLRTFGAKEVFVLDGGLKGWVAAGLPVASGPVQRPQARFAAELDPSAVGSFAELRHTLAVGGQVLDARSAGRYAGTTPEPRPGLSSGHMPGAVNVPYTELIAATHVLPEPELQAVFASKGIDLQKPVTTTCGSGVTAAVLALGLEICGAARVSLYDGSWAEYAQRPEAVIAKGNDGRT